MKIYLMFNKGDDLWYVCNKQTPLILFDFLYFVDANFFKRSDQEIVLSIKEIEDKILNEFNGHKGQSECSFDNKEDAKKCLDWLESFLILNKLVGD